MNREIQVLIGSHELTLIGEYTPYKAAQGETKVVGECYEIEEVLIRNLDITQIIIELNAFKKLDELAQEVINKEEL